MIKTKKYKLYKGDCLKILPTIKEKSIHMILADLPYGVTHHKWDSEIPLLDLWKNYENIIKDTGVIALFGQSLFMAKIIVSNEKMFRYNLIWDKMRSTGFLNAHKMPLRIHEEIAIFYKKLPVYNPIMTLGDKPSHARGKNSNFTTKIYGKFETNYISKAMTTNKKMPTSIIKIQNTTQHKYHPTEKPVNLLEYLIKTYTNENDIVLDNCMGSGSTGVACMNTHRRFIGIEKDEKYFDIAYKRIKEANNSLSNLSWMKE